MPNKKNANPAARAPRIGRETHNELGQWLSEQGLRLDDADGVEVHVPTPHVDPSPAATVGLADVEATGALDAATIQKLREAAAASRRPA